MLRQYLIRLAAALVLLCFPAWAQEVRRPTADSDNNGSGCSGDLQVATSAMANAYDSSGTSTSSGFDAFGNSCPSFNTSLCHSRFEGRKFTNWASSSGVYSSLSLKVNSSCVLGGSPGDGDCTVSYSLNNGTSFTTLRSTDLTGAWSQLTDVVTLSAGQSLSSIIISVCASGFGNPSGPYTPGDSGDANLTMFDIWTEGILLPPPATPTSLSVTPAANGLSNALAWTDNAGANATSYQIKKCSGASCTPTSYSTGLASGSTGFSDAASVSPGTVYGYQACAVNAAGASCSSTTFATTPSAPAAPSALLLSFSNTSITVSWTNNAGNATNNILQRCLGSGCTPADFQTLASTTTTFTDTAVNQKSSYTYNVVASNAVGRSAGAGTKTFVSLGHQDGHTNHKVAQ